jgi:branched-chain amino acid aminotransferase
MIERLAKIWVDGELIPWDRAQVHLLTHSLHYGLAAFEGIRAYRSANGATCLFRLREHVARLFQTCRLLGIQPRCTVDQISRGCIDVVAANQLAECYVRPLVHIGEGAMAVHAPNNPIHAAVVAWKLPAPYLGEHALQDGIRAKISSFVRHAGASLPKAKLTGAYAYGVLAKREARLGGYDEAIMLDTSGFVLEGSAENIFIVKRGVLYTPDLSAAVLEGITRDTVIALARESGLEVCERNLTREQLWLADEAFFTGTAAEVTPIREVDDRIIGDGGAGPITRRLRDRFFEVVRGAAESHGDWLTPVGACPP